MSKSMFQRILAAVLLALSFGSVPALAQKTDVQQIAELRRLRDELKATDSLRTADAVVIVSERAIAFNSSRNRRSSAIC
jgi:hypothetical protein